MTSEKLKVLELFSGIGGLHWGLKGSTVDYEIRAAVEINPVLTEIYKYNFPGTSMLQKNIEGLSAPFLNKLDFNMIAMSPPCQPFCRYKCQTQNVKPIASTILCIIFAIHFFLQNGKRT